MSGVINPDAGQRNELIPDNAERGCCYIGDKSRFLICLLLYVGAFAISGCSTLFFPSYRIGICIFSVCGLIIGLLSMCILEIPSRQYAIWKEKTGPAIAFVIYIILGVVSASICLLVMKKYFIVIFIVLQYLVLFAYNISIIDGGIATIKIAFGASKSVSHEEP